MKLTEPLSTYLHKTHETRKALPSRLGLSEEKVAKELDAQGWVSPEGKVTKRAVVDGVVDLHEGRPLWNLKRLEAFVDVNKPSSGRSAAVSAEASPHSAPPKRMGPAWVDLDTVGTYFGVGKVQVGRWLDALGLRAVPQVETNERGEVDMLEMANQAKERQAKGFISKEPTEKALQAGVARKLSVTGKGGKEFEVTQWNLDLTKAVLVKAGHELDKDHKWSLKGKGRNSNVQVGGMERRAKELYAQWAVYYKSTRDRWRIKSLFSGQPKVLLELVEKEMGMPGYLTSGQYLKDC